MDNADKDLCPGESYILLEKTGNNKYEKRSKECSMLEVDKYFGKRKKQQCKKCLFCLFVF